MIEPVYSGYGNALSSYNTDATAYNTAVTAYNTALTAKEKELPKVPVRPCPPSAPAAFTGFDIYTDKTSGQLTTLLTATANTKPFVAYVQQDNGGTVQINDSKRFGYVMTSKVYDHTTATNKVFAESAEAGHVFGRLGQGEMNMPGKAAPWKWVVGNADIQHMMVSIFPEDNYTFNAGTSAAFKEFVTGTDLISVGMSSRAYSLSDGFAAPTATGAETALTAMTGAKSLAFSAVALAAAVASLY